MSDSNTNILSLTETWQTENDPGKYDAFAGSLKDLASGEDMVLNIYSNPRCNNKRGGGVAIVFDSSIKSKPFSPNFSCSSFEFICAKLDFTCCNIVFCNIYRPPTPSGSPFKAFLDDLRDLLSVFLYSSRPAIVVGDFNIKMNNPEDHNTSCFLNLLYELNFLPLLPDSPTHQLGNTLDFAFVSSSLFPYFSSILTDNSITLSDHFPVSLSFDFLSEKPKPALVLSSYRKFNDMDIDLFDDKVCSALTSLSSITFSSFPDYLDQYNSQQFTIIYP